MYRKISVFICLCLSMMLLAACNRKDANDVNEDNDEIIIVGDDSSEEAGDEFEDDQVDDEISEDDFEDDEFDEYDDSDYEDTDDEDYLISDYDDEELGDDDSEDADYENPDSNEEENITMEIPKSGEVNGVHYEILEKNVNSGPLSLRGYMLGIADDGMGMTVTVGSGEKSSGGYGIYIKKIEVDDAKNLVVTVVETEPDEGMDTISVISYPECIVEILDDVNSVKVVDIYGEKFEMVDHVMSTDSNVM